MFYDGYVDTIVYKDKLKRVERQAALNWRTRHLKAPETKVARAVINTLLSAVLGIFLR